MKKKRIIFLSDSLSVGGIQKALIELLNKLDYSKYDVTLLLEKGEGEFLPKLNKNVTLYNLDVCDSNKNIYYRKIRNCLKRLRYIIFNYMKYDFACCYAPYSKSCKVLSLKSSKNTALYVHTDYTNEFNNDKKVISFFERQGIYNFKRIVFVSNESKDNLIKIMPKIKEKSIVINNFINEKEIVKLSEEKIDEKKQKSRKLLVYVGRLDEKVKQISKMIEVVEYLLDNDLDVDFWIVGPGPDYEYYKKIIADRGLQDNIKLLGGRLNPYPYIKLCDYLVITSHHEGFPVVFLEALALNKKIISTISVSDDEINLKEYGYIVSHDVNKMKEEVLNIIKNDNKMFKEINFDNIYNDRIKKIESLIEGDYNEI